MEKFKRLIDDLLNESSDYIYGILQDQLVEATSPENYEEIVHELIGRETSSELDISMYLNEIASPEYKALEKIIEELIPRFSDKDALDDLREALEKIRN